MEQHIAVDRSSRFVMRLRIRPDDPGHRLDVPSMLAAAGEIRRAGEDASCRAVVIEAEGEHFCAGGELGDFRRKSVDDILAFGDAFLALHTAITDTPTPVVARVQGHAFGGGANLVEACDLAYAADSALFATPEITVGLAPMMAMSGLYKNLSRKQAMALALLGERLGAAEARRLGLVNEIFPADRLAEETEDLLARLIGFSPSAIRLSKRLYGQIEPVDYRKRLLAGQGMLVGLLKSDEAIEAIDARDEGREPKWIP